MADDKWDAERVRQELARSLSDGTLLAALCHDLRGQLGVLGNWLHVLDSGGADSDIRRQAMAGMKGAVAAETRLLEQVSDLSAILRGRFALSREEVDLAWLLKDLGAEAVLPTNLQPIVTDSRRLRQLLGLVLGEGAAGAILVEGLSAERVAIRGRVRKLGRSPVTASLAYALAALLGGLLTMASEDPAFALELPMGKEPRGPALSPSRPR
jgi:hypothetical protein